MMSRPSPRPNLSGILLAATLSDGNDVRSRRLPGVSVVTPRTMGRARGMSVTHIFRTAKFKLLSDHTRAAVESVAAPAVSTSSCPYCSSLMDHEVYR